MLIPTKVKAEGITRIDILGIENKVGVWGAELPVAGPTGGQWGF